MDNPAQTKLRLRDRRRRLLWTKVSAGSFVVVVALVLFVYTAHRPEVTISSIEITGTNLSSKEKIENIANETLAGSYFHLIPKRNALVFPKGNLTNAIGSAFPEIQSASITRLGFQKLEIAITERESVALWCSSGAAAAEDCYLMDENGFIFAKATAEEDPIHFFGKISGNPIGQTFLNGEFESLGNFVVHISDATFRNPKTIVVDENDDVTITFAEGGTLMFVRKSDPKETLNNIASVFASRRFKTDETLDYADFRFGNKVYVKFQEE